MIFRPDIGWVDVDTASDGHDGEAGEATRDVEDDGSRSLDASWLLFKNLAAMGDEQGYFHPIFKKVWHQEKREVVHDHCPRQLVVQENGKHSGKLVSGRRVLLKPCIHLLPHNRIDIAGEDGRTIHFSSHVPRPLAHVGAFHQPFTRHSSPTRYPSDSGLVPPFEEDTLPPAQHDDPVEGAAVSQLPYGPTSLPADIFAADILVTPEPRSPPGAPLKPLRVSLRGNPSESRSEDWAKHAKVLDVFKNAKVQADQEIHRLKKELVVE